MVPSEPQSNHAWASWKTEPSTQVRPPSKAFRGPVFAFICTGQLPTSVFSVDSPMHDLLPSGASECRPLAGSVSCLLPPPLVPVAAAVKSTASAPGGAAAAVVATAILEEEVACLVPVQMTFTALAVRFMPFVAWTRCCVCLASTRTRDQARGAVEIHRLVVLYSALSGAQDFTVVFLPVCIKSHKSETSWNCTHVVYLPHASRGSKVEQALACTHPRCAHLFQGRDVDNGNGRWEWEWG
ncbi:hypothetical protein BASA81_015623 [Batrachochytrium salamandrivorans]|nr:hypothetical protein BASA81_015623 [Batrachochytrium salamandrivorans]